MTERELRQYCIMKDKLDLFEEFIHIMFVEDWTQLTIKNEVERFITQLKQE